MADSWATRVHGSTTTLPPSSPSWLPEGDAENTHTCAGEGGGKAHVALFLEQRALESGTGNLGGEVIGGGILAEASAHACWWQHPRYKYTQDPRDYLFNTSQTIFLHLFMYIYIYTRP